MKECPNCKREFADDLYYCLFDGTPLSGLSHGFDPNAATEVAIDPRPSDPTQVLVRPDPHTTTSSSKVPYVIIGVLMTICVVLAGAFLVTNIDRFTGTRGTKAQNTAETDPASTGATPAAGTTTLPVESPAPTQSAKKTPININPTGKWRGQWSTASGTMLDIEITLVDTQNNGVDGQIKWTMRKTIRPDKMDKIGLSAIELVRGTFDPATGSLTMSGYAKEDPNDVLVMVDDYRLTVSADGKTLSGKARNGGKWNGLLHLTR